MAVVGWTKNDRSLALGRGVLSTLDGVIRLLNLTKDTFGSASVLLTTIVVYSILSCDHELPVRVHSNGRSLDEMNQSVLGVVKRLITRVDQHCVR